MLKKLERKRRVLELGFALGIALTVLLTAFAAHRRQVADRVCADTVRLHILANSDTLEDQLVKLQVRDAILAALPDSVLQAGSTTGAEAALRQALAGIALQNLSVPSSRLFTEVTGLVPDGLTVDGLDYRAAAGDPLPTIADPQSLYLEARQGMATSDFSGVTLLVPKEAGLTELAEQINGAWQKQCSLFFSVEEVPQEEFNARLASGQYTIALAPIHAEGGSVYQMLQQFTAEGGSLTGYGNALYTERLALSAQQTGSTRCQLLSECEHQLLESCTVVPLLAQQKQLLLADGIRGLVFDPFTPVLDLTYAEKD